MKDETSGGDFEMLGGEFKFAAGILNS